MPDSEDWRRQRAEELRLNDPGPIGARNGIRRAMVDDVMPMRRPVAAASDVLPADSVLPAKNVEIPAGRTGTRWPAEPAERRYRQQPPAPPRAPVTVALSVPAAIARKLSAARHPLVLGTAIGAALAGAGALGWLLRAEVEPVPIAAPAVIAAAKPVSIAPRLPAVPVATVLPRNPIAMPDRIMPPVAAPSAVTATPPVENATLQAAAADPPPRQLKLSKTKDAAPPRQAPTKSKVVAKPAVPPQPVRDGTSRWAHPAKAVALRGRDFAPSFNCRRAIAAVNRAICASPELSALDRKVSQTFYRVTAKVDLERNKAIDRDQTNFLNERASCSSNDCVAGVYRRRLEALRQATPSP